MLFLGLLDYILNKSNHKSRQVKKQNHQQQNIFFILFFILICKFAIKFKQVSNETRKKYNQANASMLQIRLDPRSLNKR